MLTDLEIITILYIMVKKYKPTEKEKYMCDKHKKYFKDRLIEWKNEIIKSGFLSKINLRSKRNRFIRFHKLFFVDPKMSDKKEI